MAKFEMMLPKEIIEDFKYIHDNSEKIFGDMTKAGARVVMQNIQVNIPDSFKGSDIMSCLKMTRTYRTPTDGGINTKVGFYGYFINKKNIITPAPLVVNVFEYGSSKFTKKPFVRKSFNKGQIEKAMLEAQKNTSGGILK